MKLKKLKSWFARHLLLAGFCAVVAPLAAIFYLQYRSLAALENTLPAQRREILRQSLATVVKEMQDRLAAQTGPALCLPDTAIKRKRTPIRNRAEALAAVQDAAQHFSQHEFAGARRFFVVVEAEEVRVNQCAVFHYNPRRRAMEENFEVPEWLSILGSSASFVMAMRVRQQLDPAMFSVGRSLEHPMLLKPIVDAEGRIIALSGLVAEPAWLSQTLLPELSAKMLPQLFPEQSPTLKLRDHTGKLVYANTTNAANTAANEESLPVGSAFRGWTLSLELEQLPLQQWARRNFYVTLALWAVMSALLVSGVLLALRTAQRALRLSQMKSDFVSNVSHELRTPLSSIRVLGELFKLGLVADPVKSSEYGAVIEAESRRLTQLVNNILDFSHIEAGRRSFQFESLNLTEAVGETLKTLAVRHQQEEFDVRLETPDPPLPPVRMDADALMQAFVNLLDNAVKYSGDARVIVVRLAQQGREITLAVTDQGIGIPSSEHERIFERFHRVSTGLVHEVKGSGLGLALVKHIVEAHGGRVTVQSEMGRGSTFTIHLPIEVKQ